jgi:hypothetical protein
VAAPGGGVAEVFGLQANRPGDAADGELSRQHAADALPAGSAAGEEGCGWWRVASKKSVERRCSSRARLPELTEVMSMVTSAVDPPGAFGYLDRSRHMNRPRTLVSMKRRPMKATSVWPGGTAATPPRLQCVQPPPPTSGHQQPPRPRPAPPEPR